MKYNITKLIYITLCAFLVILLSSLSALCDMNIEREKFPNELTLITSPSKSSNLVAINIMLKIAQADEPSGQEGIRALLQQVLIAQAKQEIGNLDSFGGDVTVDVGLDYMEFRTQVIAEGFDTAMQALSAVLQNPSLKGEVIVDSAELGKIKNEQLNRLQISEIDPFQISYLTLREQLYHEHPYANSTDGTKTSISAISPQQIKQFYNDWFAPNNCVIAVCGNISIGQAARATEKYFSAWQAKSLPQRRNHAIPSLERSSVMVKEGKVDNAHLMIGFLAPPAVDKEGFAAFQMLDSLMGRGMSGRLVSVLRNRLGLAYQISCFYPTLTDTSHFVIYVICSPSVIEEVKTAVVEEVNRLLNEPVSKDEFEATRTYILGQYALSRQRTRQRAYYLAWYEILGLGAEFEADFPTLINESKNSTLKKDSQDYLTRMAISVYVPE